MAKKYRQTVQRNMTYDNPMGVRDYSGVNLEGVRNNRDYYRKNSMFDQRGTTSSGPSPVARMGFATTVNGLGDYDESPQSGQRYSQARKTQSAARGQRQLGAAKARQAAKPMVSPFSPAAHEYAEAGNRMGRSGPQIRNSYDATRRAWQAEQGAKAALRSKPAKPSTKASKGRAKTTSKSRTKQQRRNRAR